MGTRYVLNTTIFGQHLTATNHRTLSHTTSLLHTGFYWLHAVATMYQICVVLVVHTETETKVFGDKSHQRIHLYTKDEITHYDALIPASTGEDDASSARKRHNDGGPANEQGSDKTLKQRGTQPDVPASVAGCKSSLDDPSLQPLSALAAVGVTLLEAGGPGVIVRSNVSQPGTLSKKSGPTVEEVASRGRFNSSATEKVAASQNGDKSKSRGGNAATTRSNSTASGMAAAGQSGDKSPSQGGKGGHSHNPGGVSKAAVVPLSDKSQGGVQKKTSLQPKNPIPPRVNSSASRHMTCTHGKRRTRCPECNGKSLCPHKKQKLHCRECRKTGAFATCRSFCEHGRQRSRCKDCGGSGICKHGRDKYRCSQCR
jgi:hypothetical protein